MKPIKLDKDIAVPFSREMDKLREKGEHEEAFELMDELSNKALEQADSNSLTDEAIDNNSDTSTDE